MTKEQIQQMTALQARIDRLSAAIVSEDSTYVKVNPITNKQVHLLLYPKEPLKLEQLLPDDKHIKLIEVIIDTLKAELELLKTEMSTYILSKAL